MKKLVVCCDGTWNTLDQEKDGIPILTNVGKFYYALAERDENNVEQISYYHPGVGTKPSLTDKISGGAFGEGLDNNIKSSYRWICDHYEKNDQLFLLGFSRGAYTVRSLGGFLARCGILDLQGLSQPLSWSRVDQAYDKGYREREDKWSDNWSLKIKPADVVIDFIGVWDTVGALGIPDNLALLSLLDKLKPHQFHDTTISSKVKIGRHAIALDEKRSSFTPTLWTSIPAASDVLQVWFPGDHSDVGGGHPQIGLSDGTLLWMVQEAEQKGLTFIKSKIDQLKPNFQDVIHDSYQGVFKVFGSQPRSIPFISADVIHDSAKQRHTAPPITEKAYKKTQTLQKNQSANLRIYAAQEWNEACIYLEEGNDYEFKAEGEWIDGNIKCGPAGTDDGKFYPGELIQMGLSVLGKAEGLLQKVTKNKNANMLFTKRQENMPWFSLVGVVANGGNPTVSGTPEAHETFLIGDGCVYRVKKSGYFYAFANDAWNFYTNNRGSVSLTVSRK